MGWALDITKDSILHPGGSTTITNKNVGHEMEQETRATIGEGEISIGGEIQGEASPLLASLNRDVGLAQEVTRDEVTGALDYEVTIDHNVIAKTVGLIADGVEGIIDLAKGKGDEEKSSGDKKEVGNQEEQSGSGEAEGSGEDNSAEEPTLSDANESSNDMGEIDTDNSENQNDVATEDVSSVTEMSNEQDNTEEQEASSENVAQQPEQPQVQERTPALPVGDWTAARENAVANNLNYCNIYVGETLAGNDVYIPANQTANQLYEYFAGSDEWDAIPMLSSGELDHAAAQRAAAAGYQVIMTTTGETHGHLGIVTDQELVYSPIWGTSVPVVDGSIGGNEPATESLNWHIRYSDRADVRYYIYNR
jgi:hypothetical protein